MASNSVLSRTPESRTLTHHAGADDLEERTDSQGDTEAEAFVNKPSKEGFYHSLSS